MFSGLSQLGLWTARQVVPPDLRREIVSDCLGQSGAASTVHRGGVGLIADETVRVSHRVAISSRLEGLLTDIAVALGPALPVDVRPPDAGFVGPIKFLRYGEGGHFQAHSDSDPVPIGGGDHRILVRTGVLLFALSELDAYDGGELELYGIAGSDLPGNPFAECGIPVRIPAGAAVAFPAHTIHRVLPVTRGFRCVATAAFGHVYPGGVAPQAATLEHTEAM